MKFKEPWKNSIRSQENYDPLSKPVLLSCFIWSFVFVVVMCLSSLSQGELFLNRFWVAPALGVPLSFMIYTIKWLTPLKIESGPKGIVLDKCGNLSLIPWNKISNFEIEDSEGFRKLYLYIDGVKDLRGLILPSNLNVEELRGELRENRLHADA